LNKFLCNYFKINNKKYIAPKIKQKYLTASLKDQEKITHNIMLTSLNYMNQFK